MNKLINKHIVDVKIASDKMALLFVTCEGENLVALVDADCCSTTWIESIEMPALGLPFQILAIDSLDMPDLGDMPDCDVVSYYGAKITTTKGDMVIDYRNDSNGYYGGSIVWPNEDNYFYGGVYNQNISNQNWVKIDE